MLSLLLLLVLGVVGGEEAGLAVEFLPSVRVSCVGATITVRVDTATKLEGVVHTVGHKQDPACSQLGRGGRKTFLTLGAGGGQCGVGEDGAVVVAVRAHPTINLLQDRLFSISCRGGYQPSQPGVVVARLAVLQGGLELRAGLPSTAHHLQLTVTPPPDPGSSLAVRDCRAFSPTGTAVSLVDDRGCRNEQLISEWQVRRA